MDITIQYSVSAIPWTLYYFKNFNFSTACPLSKTMIFTGYHKKPNLTIIDNLFIS